MREGVSDAAATPRAALLFSSPPPFLSLSLSGTHKRTVVGVVFQGGQLGHVRLGFVAHPQVGLGRAGRRLFGCVWGGGGRDTKISAACGKNGTRGSGGARTHSLFGRPARALGSTPPCQARPICRPWPGMGGTASDDARNGAEARSPRVTERRNRLSNRSRGAETRKTKNAPWPPSCG